MPAPWIVGIKLAFEAALLLIHKDSVTDGHGFLERKWDGLGRRGGCGAAIKSEDGGPWRCGEGDELSGHCVL